MSDVVKKPLPYKMTRAYKPKDAFGEPRAFLNAMPKDGKGIPVDGTYTKMGVIIGFAEAECFSKRENQSGSGMEYWYGLDGQFETIPADPTLTHPTRTNKAWLPTHIHDGIRAMLMHQFQHGTGTAQVNNDGAERVDLALEIGITASSASSTGFVWTEKPLMELKAASDPLAAIRAAVGSAAQLEAPKAEGANATDADPADGSDVGDQEATEQLAKATSGSLTNEPPPPKGQKHK